MSGRDEITYSPLRIVFASHVIDHYWLERNPEIREHIFEDVKMRAALTLFELIADKGHYTVQVKQYSRSDTYSPAYPFRFEEELGYHGLIGQVERQPAMAWEPPPFTALDYRYKKGVPTWGSIGQAISDRLKVDFKQMVKDIGFKTSDYTHERSV